MSPTSAPKKAAVLAPLAEDPVPALLGQPEGRLLRVAGRQPLQPLLQRRRPEIEDDLLRRAPVPCKRMARARKFAAVAGAVLVLALLVSARRWGARDDGARPARLRLLRHRQQERRLRDPPHDGGRRERPTHPREVRSSRRRRDLRRDQPQLEAARLRLLRPHDPSAQARGADPLLRLADPARLVSLSRARPPAERAFKGVFPVY